MMAAMTRPEDTEITLALGSQRAVVSPWGASLRRYFHLEAKGGETDIVWGYSGGANKKGGQGDVLIPFPGRIAEGAYQFAGHRYQLERNDKEGPNAIHGFVRGMLWNIHAESAAHISFTIRLETKEYEPRGYPFSLAIVVTYALEKRGLACIFSIRNTGLGTAPVAAGFHPYFTVGTPAIDEAEAKIPGSHYLEFNNLVPTGKVVSVDGTEWDFRQSRRVGSSRLNYCYMDLQRDDDGLARACLRNPDTGRTITVTMDRSFTAIVVYTGDAIRDAARQALAIEPMTCATDAFNHPEWGLKRLGSEEEFTGRYEISVG